MKFSVQSILGAIALGAVILPFQNCAKDSGVQDLGSTTKTSTSASTDLKLAQKYFLGTVTQNADLSTVGANWTDVPGVALAVNVPQNMTAEMRANGSVTVVSGTTYTGSHCGLRLLVDGAPLASADATWGDVIVGLNASGTTTGWWTPWTIDKHVPLASGPHTVKLQQTGWNGTDSGCKSAMRGMSAATLTIDAY